MTITSQWDNYSELCFMQDGAPPHFALPLRAWLSDFPEWWIGRWGPTEWSTPSPDLLHV